MEGLDPCNHEEANPQLFIHAEHASAHGLRSVMIHANDTDIVVLAIANFRKLNLDSLWIAFGSAQYFRIIPVHDIAQLLGNDRCMASPMFHALTGCDTVSAFAG